MTNFNLLGYGIISLIPSILLFGVINISNKLTNLPDLRSNKLTNLPDLRSNKLTNLPDLRSNKLINKKK